jgi:hypothetical protein
MNEPTICFTTWIPTHVDVAIKAAAIRSQKSTNDLRVELIRLGLEHEQREETRKSQIQRFRLRS